MSNAEVAQLLNEMGDLLELRKDNPFRIRAFRRAAQIINSYPEEMDNLSRKALLAIPGIGQGIADILAEHKTTSRIGELETLKKEFPPGLLDIMNLQGLGPKRAGLLFHQLKIDSIDKLERAARSGRLDSLDGFGAKMRSNILKSIAFAQEASKRILISQALFLAKEIENYLRRSPFIQQLTLAGSTRRWKETIGDLDFLCTSRLPDKAIAHFIALPKTIRVLSAGKTKASLVIGGGIQCDFRVVEPLSYGAALLTFTGSKEHNVRMRDLAQKKGMTLNEYGLFKRGDEKQMSPLASRTENAVYKKLGLPWIPPELREDRGEIQAGLKNQLPTLISEKDILGDFHNHTSLSDGADSLEEMARGAEKMGWQWYFCGDHSPSLKVASGLPVEILGQKMSRLKSLNKPAKSFEVLCGSEVDILADGRLDYPDEILSDIDCVVASVHTNFKQSEEVMTARICKALRNQHVNILGHLSGRLLNRRAGYLINYDQIFETARATQTALEINGQPDRQELSDVYVKRAVANGIPVALSTDAHSAAQLGYMIFALHIARRGWAEPRHILNTLPLRTLKKRLRR